jgi:hypothetical protein
MSGSKVKTHTGNLNRSQVDANPQQGMHSAGKDNSECASLRIGNLPKAEAVRTLPVEGEKGVAAKHAADQNSSLTPDGKRVQNVVPSGANHQSTTSSGN